MTFVCLLGYHKPHIDNMMQRCILLNMYLTKCVNTRSFIKFFSSSLLLLMFSPLFFHIHLFITNHLYSSKHCQNKIGFLTDYLVGVFVIVCLCVCVYGLLQILRLCVSVNFCVCEYIIMCVRQWVSFKHMFLPQTFAFWILRNSHGDFNTYSSPHQPSNLVVIPYLATLLLFLLHTNSFEVRFNIILICYGSKCITEK